MTRAALYVNSKGYPVSRHSYSASADFKFCNRKYELNRIVGWKEREQHAALPFGSAVEAGVREYHIGGDAVRKFQDEWKFALDDPKNAGMAYSKVEVDAENLTQIGQEMLRLYALRAPSFPYESEGIQFQKQNEVEVFPNSELAGITVVSYLDMIVKMKETGEKGIIDCKTSGAKIPDYIILDPQLQTYSWAEQCPNVGFLWFQKISRAIEKGSEVTLLEEVIGPMSPSPVHFVAGADLVCLKIQKDPLGIESYWVGTETKLEEMDKLFPPAGRKKEMLEQKDKWIAENAILAPASVLTKQKVHVRIAKIPKKMADDQGKQLARDIVQIHAASQENFFPLNPGVRYPQDHCLRCAYRGVCVGDDKLRDDLLVRDDSDNFGLPKEEE